MKGYIVIEDGPLFSGQWEGGEPRAGELVFNTSHNGYEEIATDPSYYGQIMVMCAPEQGNYGIDKKFWESRQLWIEGFVCLDLDKSQPSENSWQGRLTEARRPVISEVNTRDLVLYLRDQGTKLGAIVQADSEEEAKGQAQKLIDEFKTQDLDWVAKVTRPEPELLLGDNPKGPQVALIDYGCKTNIIRELQKRCREIKIFPASATAEEIMSFQPQGIMLSNGPGNPANVTSAAETVRQLLGQKPIFGICMGHQILSRALGANTFPLKFGHRGANHPVKNLKTGHIEMTSQNHGYAVEESTIPNGVEVTHMNLNDQTVSGIESMGKKAFSVQYHPESHPGPREAEILFDQFIEWIENDNR